MGGQGSDSVEFLKVLTLYEAVRTVERLALGPVTMGRTDRQSRAEKIEAEWL